MSTALPVHTSNFSGPKVHRLFCIINKLRCHNYDNKNLSMLQKAVHFLPTKIGRVDRVGMRYQLIAIISVRKL